MQRIVFGLLSLFLALPIGCDNVESEQEPLGKTPAGPSNGINQSKWSPPKEPLPDAPVPDKKLYARSFINRPAPDFVVEQWLTGQPDREGKMLLIDFWATWCKPCIKSIPKLNELHRNHKDRLAVIGVTYESEDEVRAHPGAKINYALAIDPQKRMYNELGITHIPNVFLIDPAGIVRWQGNPTEPGYELTEEVVVELLNTYVK